MKKYILIAALIIGCKSETPQRSLMQMITKNKSDTVYIHDTVYVKRKIKHERDACDTCLKIEIPLKEIQ